jgi:peptidoglycan hydrolase-like protein with peptidoglycan-binding domain
MKWLSIAVCTALACAPLSGAALADARSGQASSSTASARPTSRSASHKKKRHSKSEPKQKAPSPDRISEIQSALSRGGYYQGDPNGKWDSNTVAAVQKFQSANGIEANGKLDAPTLQKLGLGSDIAGVSAPKPIASPSANPAPTSNAPHAPIAAPTSQSSAPADGSATTAANTSAVSPADTKLPQK